MVNNFIMESNEFLDRNVAGYYHTEFHGATHPNNPNFLYKLKNDPHHNWNLQQLQNAVNEFKRVLHADFPEILQQVVPKLLTVCVVPRAKADVSYRSDQLLFKATIAETVQNIRGFQDGSNFIRRHTNTKTTHIRKPIDGFVNDGRMPYLGISKETCQFSPCIKGLDILLVDDIYTKTINIDEDMVKALFDNGANSVVFYAIGKTVKYF